MLLFLVLASGLDFVEGVGDALGAPLPGRKGGRWAEWADLPNSAESAQRPLQRRLEGMGEQGQPARRQLRRRDHGEIEIRERLAVWAYTRSESPYLAVRNVLLQDCPDPVQQARFEINRHCAAQLQPTSSSGGFNVDSDGTCGLASLGNQVADPMLGPLADNGGATRTHALLPGSPAVDTAPSFGCPDADQRGVPRPIDGDQDGQARCDSGAFESVPDGTALPTRSATPTHTSSPTPSPVGSTSTPSSSTTPTLTAPTPSATTAPSQCSGDCDDDGMVSIDELVLAVSVALQSMPVQSCLPVDRNGDARATIDELVRAVRAAIEGCPVVERSGQRPKQQAVAL